MNPHTSGDPETPIRVEVYSEVDDVTLVFDSVDEADQYGLVNDVDEVSSITER